MTSESGELGPDELEGDERTPWIHAARRLYADRSDDDVEIDDNARVIRSGNDLEETYWVQAWVYVRQEDL